MPGPWAAPVGNGSYFPFFSEFKGADRVAVTAVETAALGLIFVLALAANACGIALLARRRSRLRASGCLVLNLFCADVLFICAIPPILVVRWTESWTLGEAACHLLFYAMSLSGSVTILSLAAVSLERVVSIVRLRPLQPCRGRVLAGVLLLIWAFSAVATLPLCLFFTVVRQRTQDGQVGGHAPAAPGQPRRRRTGGLRGGGLERARPQSSSLQKQPASWDRLSLRPTWNKCQVEVGVMPSVAFFAIPP